MAAAVHPPLVVPMRYDPSFKVDVRLHESLLATAYTSSDVDIEMMSLCAQLDALCKKELVMQPSHRIDHGKTSSSFVNKANVVFDHMRQLLLRSCHHTDVQEYMESKGIDRLFPRAAAYIYHPDKMSLSLKKTNLDNYFSQLATLHQLSTLARQINNDVLTHDRPKYIAHQLALLYQSINAVQNNNMLAVLKKNIEDNFKVVKSCFMNDGDRDSYPPELKEWLLTITSNIVSIIEEFPVQLTEDMLQPAYILAQSS
ncbi:uncharacterized protein LOC121370422 [Gigantopelta aegis]|uniref:uncharacterized protein LOC121370422 n=1 Tax=Gigantopelta aegis TaxID=1735272 RepID=UPI001B88B2FA|nr:uncharacterized protein LOC121370422 [Gigantopelta aegis]